MEQLAISKTLRGFLLIGKELLLFKECDEDIVAMPLGDTHQNIYK